MAPRLKTEITQLFHWHCYSVECSWQLLHQHGSKRNMHWPVEWQIRYWTMWELCWPLENRIMKYSGKSLTTMTLNIEIKVIMFLHYILFSVIFSPLNKYKIICSSTHSPPLPLPPPLTYLAEVSGLSKWLCVIWFSKMGPNVHLYPQGKSCILKMGW